PLSVFSGDAGQFFAGHAPMLAGARGGRQREKGVAGGAPASPVPSQVGDSNDGLVAAVVGEWMPAAAPVPPGRPESAHGGGVAAALGGEVAAVAEHVRPAAQRLKVLVRVAAELKAGSDQPSLVAARGGVDVGVVGGDPPGQGTDGLGGLG